MQYHLIIEMLGIKDNNLKVWDISEENSVATRNEKGDGLNQPTTTFDIEPSILGSYLQFQSKNTKKGYAY